MKNKLCVLGLIMIMILSVLSISVQALSFNVSMTPNKTRVEDASEFTVTVKVSNLDVGSNGINGLTASLAYDTEVFETINESNIDGLNNWSVEYETNGKVSAKKNSFVNDDEEVFQITLKTKSGVEEGKTGTVSLSNIIATNSDDKIDATKVSTTITIGSQQTTITPPTSNNSSNINNNTIQITPNNNTSKQNESNNTTNNVTNNATNNVVSNYTSNNSSNSNQDMPYTGTEGNSIVKIIIGIVLIAIVIYIKIEKLKEIR